MPICAIKNCKSRLGRKSAYYSYFFPRPEKSPDRFASWCEHADLRSVHNKSSRVCAIHFELDDFDESDIMKIRLTPSLFKNLTPKLKKGVVPTLILGNEGEEDSKEGISSSSYVKIRDVQDILDDVPSGGHFDETDSQPSTSWMFPTCEIKIEEGDVFGTVPRNSVAIQCEFGAEVYRGFDVGSETVDK